MSSGCVSDIINSGQLTSGVKFITVSVSKLLLEKFMYRYSLYRFTLALSVLVVISIIHFTWTLYIS